MPFSLCNAPSTFQRLMERVLVGLARNICTVYLDDISVMGGTFDEDLHNLQSFTECWALFEAIQVLPSEERS